MRLAVPASILLAVATSTASALDQRDIAALISLRPSVLKVEASNARGAVGVGTGVAVAPGVIATACHVTAQATSVRVVSNGERMQVAGQRAQVGRDLCLLDVPGASQVPPVPLRETPLKPGEELVALGYILGAAPRVSNGTVLRLHEHDGGRVIQSTTPFTSGASGGGMFDRDGRLVGLMAFKFRAGTDNQFSVPASWIVDGLGMPPGADVAPLSGHAFWDERGGSLPPFLQTLRLEAEQRWSDLERLAGTLIAQDAGSASAWHALGRARSGTGRHADAASAYARADEIERDNPVFMSDLAFAQYRNRDDQAFSRTRAGLARLSQQAAEALDARVNACEAASPAPC